MKKFFLPVIALLLFSPFIAMANVDSNFDNNNLSSRLSGKTLLATESNGQIWYVNPDTKARHYLGKPDDFLDNMKQLALGISKKDLNSFKNKAPRRLAGKFLLLVEEAGKIAYVNPDDLKIHKFENTKDAISAMRKFSLGISNTDLSKINFNDVHKKIKHIQSKKDTAKKINKVLTKKIKKSNKTSNSLAERLKKIAEEYINNELLNNGSAIIKSIKPLFGVHELKVKMSSGDEIVSYISNDGKKFFPQGIDIVVHKNTDKKDKADKKNNKKDKKNDKITVNKQKKPTVELFVMSYCPYGTQIEKGILPVVKKLGNSINFKLKFVYYVMHGQKEIDEQLNQYCIQKEQSSKFITYLNCFLEKSDGSGCLTTANIDTNKLKKCVVAIDSKFGINAGYSDKTTWLNNRYPLFGVDKTDNTKYGVGGSPTLILNGKKVSSGRDSASLLKTICNSFITKPSACNASLSSASPSPGFGFGTTTNKTTSGCGN